MGFFNALSRVALRSVLFCTFIPNDSPPTFSLCCYSSFPHPPPCPQWPLAPSPATGCMTLDVSQLQILIPSCLNRKWLACSMLSLAKGKSKNCVSRVCRVKIHDFISSFEWESFSFLWFLRFYSTGFTQLKVVPTHCLYKGIFKCLSSSLWLQLIYHKVGSTKDLL